MVKRYAVGNPYVPNPHMILQKMAACQCSGEKPPGVCRWGIGATLERLCLNPKNIIFQMWEEEQAHRRLLQLWQKHLCV